MDHVDRAKQMNFDSPVARLHRDAFYAYNCAIQDLTPKALEFIAILGTSVIPKIERTHEMIRSGVVPQFKARVILAVDIESGVDEIDLATESFVWFKNRLMRPGQFLAVYIQIPASERFKVLTFYEPYFCSEESDAAELAKAYFNHVSLEVHLMMQNAGGIVVKMSDMNLVSLRQGTGGLVPHETPGFARRDRGGYTEEEWRQYNSQWSQEEWEEWRARRTQRTFHHHQNRAGWGWDQNR